MTTEQRSPATSYPAAGYSDPTIEPTIGDALRLAARSWGSRPPWWLPAPTGKLQKVEHILIRFILPLK